MKLCNKIASSEPLFFPECSLTLKSQIGWLDSTIFSDQLQNCTFHFSHLLKKKVNEPSQGVLFKLLRLNVPCDGGGYLQVNGSIKMCGKLEEITDNRRVFYTNTNLAIKAFNFPNFLFIYKLEDYCYNITLQNQNDSFVILPEHIRSKCHLKIHLPYGNQISLKLWFEDITLKQNVVSKHINLNRKFDEKTSKLDEKLNQNDFHADARSANKSSNCTGIWVEIFNRQMEGWTECFTFTIPTYYTLPSTDNILFIHITSAFRPSQISTSAFPSIILEYTSVPIEEVVSQCAYGFILLGQSCVSVFYERLTWKNAEYKCNDFGGHLASIRDNGQQFKADQMLLNR